MNTHMYWNIAGTAEPRKTASDDVSHGRGHRDHAPSPQIFRRTPWQRKRTRRSPRTAPTAGTTSTKTCDTQKKKKFSKTNQALFLKNQNKSSVSLKKNNDNIKEKTPTREGLRGMCWVLKQRGFDVSAGNENSLRSAFCGTLKSAHDTNITFEICII